MDISLWETVFLIIAIVGWVGSILPALPGLPLSFLALTGYAIATGFFKISLHMVAFAAVLTVVNYTSSYYLGAKLARRYGQVQVPALAVFLGSILGLTVFGPLGFVIGPVIVVFGKALLSGVGPGNGLRSAAAVVVSMVFGVLLEFFLSSWMVFLLVRAVLR